LTAQSVKRKSAIKASILIIWISVDTCVGLLVLLPRPDSSLGFVLILKDSSVGFSVGTPPQTGGGCFNFFLGRTLPFFSCFYR
jgi:hypothetical protein